jgi:hypothetical protein
MPERQKGVSYHPRLFASDQNSHFTTCYRTRIVRACVSPHVFLKRVGFRPTQIHRARPAAHTTGRCRRDNYRFCTPPARPASRWTGRPAWGSVTGVRSWTVVRVSSAPTYVRCSQNQFSSIHFHHNLRHKPTKPHTTRKREYNIEPWLQRLRRIRSRRSFDQIAEAGPIAFPDAKSFTAQRTSVRTLRIWL